MSELESKMEQNDIQGRCETKAAERDLCSNN